MATVRTTMHHGRSGKHGVYSAKHNSRSFNVENADHIDPDRVQKNRYLLVSPSGEITSVKEANFDKHEKDFYATMFGDALEAQNERYRSKRNYDRVKSIDDYRTSKQTCPEEIIFQIGTRTDKISAKTLGIAVSEWISTVQRTYGTHVHIMDVAVHLDEQTPHAHCRLCYSHDTPDGRAVSQTKALAALGIERPDMDKPKSQHNNAKQTFTEALRSIWVQAVQSQGIDLETSPAEPGKRSIDLEDYVYQLQKAEIQKLTEQKEQLIHETEKLAVEREQLQHEVAVLKAEKTRLQRITERLKSSCMRLFQRLAQVVCADGRCALEHVKTEAQAVLDAQEELTRDEIDTDER